MLRVYSFLAFVGMLTSQLLAENFPAPLKSVDLSEGDSIVFLGDSITHQCLYTQYVEDFFYTRFPEMRLKFHNSGVGGARAWDALQRFDDDVAAYKPKYVTVLLGMNDGTYRPYDDPTFQTYRQDMTEVINRITAIGAVPILMTPTMFDARAARINPKNQRSEDAVSLYNSVLAYYGTWCRDVAVERGFGFVDMWGPLNNLTLEARKTNPEFTLIKDSVHPGESGQLIMAVAMINDLGLQRRVSSIRLEKTAGGEWKQRVTGGKLSGLEFKDDQLTFQWKANSLPWVVPEEAAEGVSLTKLGHRLSQEALEIHGIEPGRYELEIDGTVVGTYDASALGRHIELQSNSKTPQYKQALEVAMLNKSRNENAVRSLRNEWRNFQQLARARRALEAQPDSEELKKQVATLEKKDAGRLERVAKFEEEAKTQEDRIYEVNQPQTRTYVIRKKK